MNERFGEHGLMKRFARSRHPHFLINRKTVRHLFPLMPATQRRKEEPR
jgi:hypothetical protein